MEKRGKINLKLNYKYRYFYIIFQILIEFTDNQLEDHMKYTVVRQKRTNVAIRF